MSKVVSGMLWFKHTFGAQTAQAVQGTPFSVDLLTAIAVQETFYIWGSLIGVIPDAQILEVCVGDTLDKPNRGAFPVDKADLLSDPNGEALFQVARQALADLAQHNATYAKILHAFPNKFCHGFGIFQYDIQFSKAGINPQYFLQHQWFSFTNCLNHALSELNAALKRAYGQHTAPLTDEQATYVAIAYNAGHVKVGAGFKQGYKDQDGKYYGEYIHDYLTLAHSVPGPALASGPAVIPTSPPE